MTNQIAQKTLTLMGVMALSKVYDGTTDATISGGVVNGILDGDKHAVTLVSAGAKGAFRDKDVGLGKPVTVSGFTLTGAGSSNYEIVLPTSLKADITGVLYPNVTPQVVMPPASSTISLPVVARVAAAAQTAQGVRLDVSVMPVVGNTSNILPIGKLFTISSERPAQLMSVSISIVSGFVLGQTALEIDVPAGLIVFIDDAKGRIEISGAGSLADYQKVLRSLKLRTSEGQDGKLTLRVSVMDASGSSQSRDVDLSRGDVAKKLGRLGGVEG